eukprot:56003-Eustigmatos_ZCMA.PRE.1
MLFALNRLYTLYTIDNVNAAFHRMCWATQDAQLIGLVLDTMSVVLRAYRNQVPAGQAIHQVTHRHRVCRLCKVAG